jgi:hypothetical protein
MDLFILLIMSHYTAVNTIIGSKHIDLFFSVYLMHILHSRGLKLEIKIIAVQKKWQRIPITPCIRCVKEDAY